MDTSAWNILSSHTMHPTRRQVEDVMKGCECAEEVALHLLNRYDNNVDKAIRRYPWHAQQQAAATSAATGFGALSLDPSPNRGVHPQIPAMNSNNSSTNSAPWQKFNDSHEDDTTLVSHYGLATLPASPTSSTSSFFSAEPNSVNNKNVTIACRADRRKSNSNDYSDADEAEWDFVLPASQVFDDYLDLFRRGSLPQQIDLQINKIPSIFFAVATNDEAILRQWVARGGDVSAIHEPSGVPLLAFAIANSEAINADTTPMVATLLSLGASPDSIPSEFYAKCINDLPKAGPPVQSVGDDVDMLTWCSGPMRQRLAHTMNLTHRYQLWKATQLQRFFQRQKQVAVIKSAEPLLGLAYFLVGQTLATNVLLQKLLTHLANPSKNRKKPLVLVFAGPSGHGKTELARRMGHLLSLELQVVDCTVVNHEMELFGPRPGYVGSENGSPLNNFMSRNSGRRSIVFLDEFDKTTLSIHQSLLLPFDNGESEDRRSRGKVDCSQTIFIIATNALDNDIQNFCNRTPDIFSENGQQQLRAAKDLSPILRQGFLQRFGAPLTGRMSDFIPFLPFTSTEQAAVAHKFLLEMIGQVQKPVRLMDGPDQQLLGDIRLRIRQDGTFCSTLAANSYHRELGARSLKTAVEQVLDYVTSTYLKTDEQIEEGAGMSEYVMDIDGDEVVVNRISAQ